MEETALLKHMWCRKLLQQRNFLGVALMQPRHPAPTWAWWYSIMQRVQAPSWP